MDKEKLDKLLLLIIYGDIHEAPFSILGEFEPKPQNLDTEQYTRVSIAATIKQFVKDNKI